MRIGLSEGTGNETRRKNIGLKLGVTMERMVSSIETDFDPLSDFAPHSFGGGGGLGVDTKKSSLTT